MTSDIPSAAPVSAAGSPHVRNLLRGPTRPADILGRFTTALYVRVDGGEVIALLSSDAVRLPIGLVLPTPSHEVSLSSLTGSVAVGGDAVRVGPWTCRGSRPLSVQAPTDLTVDIQACTELRCQLRGVRRIHDHLRLVDDISDAVSRGATDELVGRLLGAGPGLTPAGDDILAGLLVGLWSCGGRAEPLRAAVLAAAPGTTTDLSAALLRCAARGEAIPEVGRLLQSMSGSASRRHLDQALAGLMSVGHTSGAALATGVLAAVTVVVEEREESGRLDPRHGWLRHARSRV